MKSTYQLIGKLTSKGGFKKEGNYDSLEVRYYYKTLNYSPKVSIILQSFNKLNGEDKEFERKSFRINCEEIGESSETDKILIICNYLSKAMGFVYGNKMRESIKEMDNQEKNRFFKEILPNISEKKFSEIIKNFKDGFRESEGLANY